MKNTYRNIERIFEKIVSFITAALGNSIAFIAALTMIIFWLGNKQFRSQGIYDSLRDFIQAITFLSLFIIQKAFNRFAGSMHLKINELVASNESANNALISIEEKTEHEISILSKEYTELAEQAKNDSEKADAINNQ